jgi:ribosome-binding protein aMBF1 (putative translation factor)
MQRSQIRAGRALLAWTQEHLADTSGVPLSVIQELEAGAWSTHTDQQVMDQLIGVLEHAGVTFIPANDEGGPGVRLHRSGLGSETVSGEMADRAEEELSSSARKV